MVVVFLAAHAKRYTCKMRGFFPDAAIPKKLLVRLLTITALFLWPVFANAQDSAVRQAVQRMEKHYRAAKTLQATFLERYTEGERTVRLESGTAYFRRAGKMRWEYEAPEKNLFLVDGKMAWFYVPADHTVTRVPLKESSDWRTPLALLAGEMKVSRVCAHVGPAKNIRPERPDNVVFECQLRISGAKSAASASPKSTNESGVGGSNAASQRTSEDSDERMDPVLIEVDVATGELARIVVRNKGGVGIEFHFANWQTDPIIADAVFHFQPPPGVAIVNGDAAVQTGAPQ